MGFKLSRPGSTTERADNEPAETDPAKADPAGTDPAETDPAETGPAGSTPADSEPVAEVEPVAEAEPPDVTVPDVTGGPATAGVPAPRAADAAFTGPPGDDAPLDGPLLPDAAQLRGNWQQVQASFVDDPRGSVAEAAALVDHAAQALAGALRQRQRRLRESWDTADGATDGASLGTEELRVAMQRYRTLFNYVCRP
jgi:hypothetical protein